MTSDEREEWIEQLLSGVDVVKTEIVDPAASFHAPDPPQENPEEDFTSHSGGNVCPAVFTQLLCTT